MVTTPAIVQPFLRIETPVWRLPYLGINPPQTSFAESAQPAGIDVTTFLDSDGDSYEG